MEEKRSFMPANLRYPLFFLGLLIMIGGGLLGMHFNASSDVDATLAVVGFILIVISVSVR